MGADENASNLGRDLLFVLLWVGAWGTIELAIQWLSANKRIQLVLYVILFVAGFISLMFVDSTALDGKGKLKNSAISLSSI